MFRSGKVRLSSEMRPYVVLPKRRHAVAVASSPLTTGLFHGDGDPAPQRLSGLDWPTLVTEAGCSQPLLEIRQEIRWRSKASGHQVKTVLAKFDHGQGNIVITPRSTLRSPF